MNPQTIIYKLQMALKQKGIILCITTIQVYDKQKNEYVKVYRVRQNKQEILKTSSQNKVIQLLNSYWQEVKNE